MTKDEIKQLIAAKIAGQGSAIDAASVLPTILDAIVDAIPEEYSLPVASAETLGGIKVGENLSITEGGVLSAQGGGNEPLVVNGTFSTGQNAYTVEFTPNPGEPTFNEALSAFRAGKSVILKGVVQSAYDVEAKVFSYGGDAGGYGYGLCGNAIFPEDAGMEEASEYKLVWREPQA